MNVLPVLAALLLLPVHTLAATPLSSTYPVSTRQVQQWRKEIREALFIPNRLPSPSPKIYGHFSPSHDVIADRVTYETQYGLRVPAIVYRPAKSLGKRLPALVVVNGHGADKSSWYSWYTAILYARAGAVVLTYDPIGEGERNDDHKHFTGQHDKPIKDPESMPVRLGGFMIADILQAVSYLTQRADVDPDSIGVMGFSMGSFHSALAGTIDPRIRALLLVGGGDLDGPGGYWDSSHAIMCQSAPYNALSFLGDRPAVLYTLSARRGETFIINGTNDTVVDIPHHGAKFFAELAGRVEALNGNRRGVFKTYFDQGASHRPSWMTRVAAEWLNQQLHFPQWSLNPLENLPVVSVKEWAASVGLPLGKSSGRNDRDAGIEAIAADVPLLTEQQTDVLGRSAWEALKADLVYATWVHRATAAASLAEPSAQEGDVKR